MCLNFPNLSSSLGIYFTISISTLTKHLLLFTEKQYFFITTGPVKEDEGSKKPEASAQPAKPADVILVAEVVPEKISLAEKAPLADKPIKPQVVTVDQTVQSTEPIKSPEIQKPVQETPIEKPMEQRATLPVSPVALKPQPSSNEKHIVPEKEQKN